MVRVSAKGGNSAAAWHVAVVFLSAEKLPPMFLLAAVAVTFVYTWIYLRTNGSVFMTMLAHSAEGTIKIGTLGLVGAASARMTILYSAAWCILALALVLIDRKTWKRTPAAVSPRTNNARAQVPPLPTPVAI